MQVRARTYTKDTASGRITWARQFVVQKVRKPKFTVLHKMELEDGSLTENKVLSKLFGSRVQAKAFAQVLPFSWHAEIAPVGIGR